MVYRFYARHGELLRIKIWTKTGVKELSHAVKFEHHPITRELLAIVRCAVVIQVPNGVVKNEKPEYMEQEYLICVAEKYNSLLAPEEFMKKEKMLKNGIIENVKNNYKAISFGTRSIWEWD